MSAGKNQYGWLGRIFGAIAGWTALPRHQGADTICFQDKTLHAVQMYRAKMHSRIFWYGLISQRQG